MSITVNVGWSNLTNSYEVGKNAAIEATKDWQENIVNLGLTFASAKYNQYRLIAGIREIIPNIPLIGCTAANIITPEGSLKSGVAIAILSSRPATLQYSFGLGRNIASNSREAGYQTARAAINSFINSPFKKKFKAHKKCFIIFPDGVSGNGADLLRGCQEVLGINFPIIGGSASDSYIFKKTYQYFPKGVTTGSIVGILLGGNIEVGIGTRHGWKPLGSYKKVTKSNLNVIQEIDNHPAISIYREYFGEETRILQEGPLSMMGMLYPIGMKIPEEKEYLVRIPFKTGENGELICTSEVPEGTKIRLMIGNRNDVLMTAREAAVDALNNLGQRKPNLILMFSSVSRKRLLGREYYKEIRVIKNIIGNEIPIIGFYSYGEQSPLSFVEKYPKQSYFHNEAIVVTVIGE